MKQFRSIWIILAMAALAAGCAKTEYIPASEKEVTFTVGKYATEITKTSPVSVDGITSFQSRGYLHAEGVSGTQDFFGADGETISYDGTSLWQPSHPYYWPKGDNSYVNFVSWYANNGIVPTTVSETQFIVTREIAATDNILIADEAWRYHANAAEYYTSGVPTLFHHVLSRVQINFKATSTSDPDNASVTYDVILQNVSLQGIYRRGTMTLSNSDISDTGTHEWYSIPSPTTLWETANGSNQTPFSLVSSNLTLGNQSNTVLELRSFMPQVLGNGAKLSITYTIVSKSGGTETARECDIPATVVLNTIENTDGVNINQWLPNRKYNYTIAINPVSAEIVLNPVVESNWEDYLTMSAVVE